jgi:streptomycin 6-kinase
VVADARGFDGDRLFGWSQVIAPMLAIAHLTRGGPQAAVEELLTVSA